MLTYNAKDRSFVLITKDKKEAERVGLTLSKKAKGQNGEHVFFTADHDKNPTHNAYAALPFWKEADDKARAELAPFRADYDASWQTDHPQNFPRPGDKDYLPFQKAGIAYAMRKGNILIGDEMGLGKTVEGIGIANAIGAKRVLVVCPAAIRLNWQREIRNWSTIPNVSTYPILKGGNGVSPYANFVIVSYDLCRNAGLHDALCDGMWDLVLVDEAHFLKEISAKRTQAVFGSARGQYSGGANLASRAGQIVGLTGTPLVNRPRECYTLARALCWEAIDWCSYDSFVYRFNPSGEMNSGFVIEKKGRLPELQARLRCNFMIRRLKQDVLKDLPDRRFEFAYVEPNGAISQALSKEKLINFTLDDLKNPFSDIMGQISTVRREMGEAKVPRVVEHMRYLLDIEEIPKIVLFAHHRSVMDALAMILAKYGVVSVRGGVSQVAKQAAVDDFIGKPEIRIFLGQLDSAGFGIDGLQSVSSRVVFAEPSWTPGGNQQALDRCHRIGQHDNVLGQFLIAEGSLDERVLGTVLDKAHTIHDSLDRVA
jgi:SWI/SNF-related matrix-associated actin-dependent regulator 1 of chromatin subfamily A